MVRLARSWHPPDFLSATCYQGRHYSRKTPTLTCKMTRSPFTPGTHLAIKSISDALSRYSHGVWEGAAPDTRTESPGGQYHPLGGLSLGGLTPAPPHWDWAPKPGSAPVIRHRTWGSPCIFRFGSRGAVP